MATKSPRDGLRRSWTDPVFFAILGVVSLTYVVLIVAMLGADAVYLFSGNRDIPVAVEFEVDGDGKLLTSASKLSTAFAAYGMAIELEDAPGCRLALLNSGQVAWPQRELGTPNEEFGGPGVGRGGGRDSSAANTTGLQQVLVVAQGAPGAPRYECRFDFAGAARIGRIRLARPAPALIQGAAYSASDGAERAIQLAAGAEEASGPEEPVRRLLLWSPTPFGEVTVDYELLGAAAANPGHANRTSLSAMSVYIADAETARVALADQPATVRVRWEGPVSIDQVTIVNAKQPVQLSIERSGGDRMGRTVRATGANGVRAEDLEVAEAVALMVDLPPGAAIGALRFRWPGRVPTDWERRHPRLAKLAHNTLVTALKKKEIQYSIKLSLISCTITTIISLWVAVPVGYLLSRYRFPFHNFIDAVLDIPIVLPPLVVGLSLLILFQFFPQRIQERVVYEIPAVILAQVSVACAFAVRSMRASFDLIDRRREQVALTLGCTRAQAFFYVVAPEAGRGMLTAATLAWARALGEFGPLLIFAGATRMKTEVLSTTVFLELSVGDLGAAVAVSLIMVASAIIVLVLARMWGSRALSI